MQTKVKTTAEIDSMRVSGQMLASVLSVLEKTAAVDMTTKDLANIAKQELRSLGGQPTFLGYQGFPDVLCVSVNEEVVHGIPSTTKVLDSGDVVSLDFGVTYKGMITDSAITIILGKARPNDQKLVNATKLSLEAAIDIMKDNIRVGDISGAIQGVLEPAGYGIVRDLVGHGVGHELHEEPNIPNHGKPMTGQKLLAGMTVAVEPMATLGSYQVITAPDGWTILTKDNSRAAHFEHTILITDTGAEVLTNLKDVR